MNPIHEHLKEIQKQIKGDIYTEDIWRKIYATDASAYKEEPYAVILPKNKDDVQQLIFFAQKHKIALIPRAAGTSLAGQVVGKGIIVDISKYMTNILELNVAEKWVRVQPGVILDELNKYLEPHGLYFGPETSTSNRCMIGGMVGNNSCGSHSLIYKSTREHLIEIKAYLSNGEEVVFSSIDNKTFNYKCTLPTKEGELYKHINTILSDLFNQNAIRESFPDKDLDRRNTGYALDILLETAPFTEGKENFNFCKLIAGSEGTLAFVTEIRLNLVPLPPKETALVCIHLNNIEEALYANIIALKYQPTAIELMDRIIMDCTKENISQRKNRFFIQGDPGALLLVEFAHDDKKEIEDKAKLLETELRSSGYGFHFPMLYGEDIKKVWALRKAGLGLLSNIPGDAKPVPVIEDTAVLPQKLPLYIADFQKMLNSYGLNCVYYAHIATGELHLRPVLNLKDPKDIELFHTIAFETAKLVKKYNGSLSGEHGDGRLRGEFISLMVGRHNYQLMCQLKKIWDPNNIFNPNKIIDTPKMNEHLRYTPGQETKPLQTTFDFAKDMGMMRSIEKCNGAADCRKTEIIGGLMCPSYMATRSEKATPRARANILREYLTNSKKTNPFNHKEIYEIMDLCLSCKGCKSECPSGIDITRLKAEFLQQYYTSNRISLRTQLIANISTINHIGAIWPACFNYFATNKISSRILKTFLGFAQKRSIPKLSKITFSKWALNHNSSLSISDFPNGKVSLFIDEFTEYNDTLIGIKTVEVLNQLGYYVEFPKHKESGRTFLSKGLINKAKELAISNVSTLSNLIDENMPLIGIEPSGILSFRDEYPDLVGNELKEKALNLAKNTYLFDEFIAQEISKGKIDNLQFKGQQQKVILHGHCHQKSLASIEPSKQMLEFTGVYNVELIPSGCCGMAGSFGYEKEHYDISMKIGNLTLFPSIRKAKKEYIISAPGTSCRHQIKDGTGKEVFHPIELMHKALLK